MNYGGEGEVNFRVCNLEEMSSEIEGGSGGGGNEENQVLKEGGGGQGEMSTSTPYYLDKFTLFETPSNFYMIGRDKERQRWRVLKIDRLEPSELVIYEDPTVYSYGQCRRLLEDVNEGNKLTGGRKFVTDCYGIVGFVKFLGPYYILLITERKEIGQICGHTIYGISDYKMIQIPHSTVWSCMDNSEREIRYKKLLWAVDIRKDFFFSYSYPIMHCLQKNLSQKDAGRSPDGTMFVWNEYLTHQIRNHLKNTLWTVALVHGFFKQVELSTSGKNFLLTLIARRSCQFAGTRYHKRGVNEEGQAANDVEIEQIVSQKSRGDSPCKSTSVVQIRGSIPLSWSQKASLWNIRPDVLISEGSNSYEATKLHFLNLRLRYGDPIILLSLIKTCEKGREYLLHKEFHKAVACINKGLAKEHQLTLLSRDLNAEFRSKNADVVTVLKDEAASALKKIGFFSCQISQPINFKATYDLSYFWIYKNSADSQDFQRSDCNYISKNQYGIFRINCLDSLDRTNFAQYVYGLVAFDHQLDALGIIGSSEQDLSDTLMSMYEAQGDALAEQYGGSAAHSKIFSHTRGQCKAATLLQELMKSVQRHFNNSFMDFDKQQAIDIFLGQFRPDESASLESALNWKYGGRRKSVYMKNMSRSRLKRSQSDSKIDYKSSSALGGKSEISSSESDYSDSRCTPYVYSGHLLTDFEKHWYGGLNKDADEVGSLSWTENFEDSGHEESYEGWCIVKSPASSSGG